MELARENQIWGYLIQGSVWTWISIGRAGNPRLTVHWLIAYSLPGEALVSTSFKAQNLIRSWFKKKPPDPPPKKKNSVHRLSFKWCWDIINFLRYKSSIVVPWENLLTFRRYMLKYLEVKFYDACNLLWDGSEGRKKWNKKQTLQNVNNCWIQLRCIGVHYTILLNSLYFTGWHNKKLWGKALNKHPICWFGAY